MVKAPSLSSKPAHGLDKKYKSWRRKQSKNASSSGSLKQQLRGQERLLLKFQQQQSDDIDNDTSRLEQLKDRIQQLQQQIADRQQTDRTKQFAKDSHGTRFLERQKLTRMEAKARNETTSLLALALDLAYVAHYYPVVDQKYLPLLRQGERRVDDKKRLVKRAAIRARILQALPTAERVKWIAADLYDMLPTSEKEWTVDDERRVFGCETENGGTNSKAAALLEDDRFTVKPQQDAILQAALELEQNLEDDDDEEVVAARNKEDDSSQSSHDDVGSGDSEDDDADPLTHTKSIGSSKPSVIPNASKANRPQQGDDESSSDSSSSDDSDSESPDAEGDPAKNGDQDDDDSSSSSSSSSAASVDDRSGKDVKAVPSPTVAASRVDDDEDDFLVAADDDAGAAKAFDKPKMFVPGMDRNRGDKSKGWETQRQRPGQFKKRRVRR